MSQLVKKDCGKHWGQVAGKCSKCALNEDYQRKGCLQYGGTPWLAVIEPAQGQSLQDRAIESAHKYNQGRF